MNIEDVGFSTRVMNVLMREYAIEPKTMQRVSEMTEVELLRLPNLGRKGVREIKQALSDMGLSLSEPEWMTNTQWVTQLGLSEFFADRIRRTGLTLEEVLDGGRRKLLRYGNLGHRTVDVLEAALERTGHIMRKPGIRVIDPPDERLQKALAAIEQAEIALRVAREALLKSKNSPDS